MAINGETVLQWNVQGLTTFKQDLVKLIDESHPGIIALQEIFQCNNSVIKLGGYSNINQRCYGGVALFIHTSLPYEQLELNTPLQVVAARVQIEHQRLITCASPYIPGSNKITKQQLLEILNQLPRPIILMGDLNAHHKVWGGRNWRDQRGKMLENIVVTEELNILNNGSPTHISGTSVNITIASPNVAPDLQWTVLPSVISSGHYPIVITMTTAGYVV